MGAGRKILVVLLVAGVALGAWWYLRGTDYNTVTMAARDMVLGAGDVPAGFELQSEQEIGPEWIVAGGMENVPADNLPTIPRGVSEKFEAGYAVVYARDNDSVGSVAFRFSDAEAAGGLYDAARELYTAIMPSSPVDVGSEGFIFTLDVAALMEAVFGPDWAENLPAPIPSTVVGRAVIFRKANVVGGVIASSGSMSDAGVVGLAKAMASKMRGRLDFF